jgi:CheY-like chemotaxis protein
VGLVAGQGGGQAAGTSDDRISGLSLGADDYLTKPSTSPNSCSASTPWPAASPPPGPASTMPLAALIETRPGVGYRITGPAETPR